MVGCRTGFLADGSELVVVHNNNLRHAELQEFVMKHSDTTRADLIVKLAAERFDGPSAVIVSCSERSTAWRTGAIRPDAINPLNLFMMLEVLPHLE